mmetsp:Transcript_31759/g.62897  ORF Transcript_31759/g.62897 Transcript_31759/m.62897 type:complete len:112 (+) Transcript_31759:1098-1433(+)
MHGSIKRTTVLSAGRVDSSPQKDRQTDRETPKKNKPDKPNAFGVKIPLRSSEGLPHPLVLLEVRTTHVNLLPLPLSLFSLLPSYPFQFSVSCSSPSSSNSLGKSSKSKTDS